MLNLYIEHDARALARLTGAASAPDCDTIILKHGDASTVLASSHRGNPLGEAGEHWMLNIDSPTKRTIAWSGTLASDLFAADARTWLRPGREAFARFCDEIEPQLLRHDRKMCFHPHARHVLNDVPSCMAFQKERDSRGAFEVALAPASMLEPVMLDQVEDHLQRQFESLGGTCALVLLSDVQVAEGEDGESRCGAVPLGEGVLPRDVVLRLLREWVPATTPIVIQGRAIERQLQWLAC